MSWDTLTADDVLSEFNASERVNIANVVGADNLAAITARVVSEVRGACLAGGNVVSTGDTIPDQLIGDAIAIAKWRFVLALPNMPALQSKPRFDAYTESRALLREISAGSIKVQLPTAGTEIAAQSTPGNAIEVGSNLNSRFVTRTTMDGL